MDWSNQSNWFYNLHFKCYQYNKNVYFSWRLSSHVPSAASTILKKDYPGYFPPVAIPFANTVSRPRLPTMVMANFLLPVLRITSDAKWLPKIPTFYLSTVPFLKSHNQPRPKPHIKTHLSNCPKLPRKRNFNKIWKFTSLRKKPITTCLNNHLTQKPILNAPNFSEKNKINF